MNSRRSVLAGLAGLTASGLAGCGGRAPAPRTQGGVQPPPAGASWTPSVAGLDAVIDISHNVQVSDFRAVRRANILAVIHKTSEGGDWVDPSYASRRAEAEAHGLLWGAYHFGTRQSSGVKQAATFLKAAQPGPSTLLALMAEPAPITPGVKVRVSRTVGGVTLGWVIKVQNVSST